MVWWIVDTPLECWWFTQEGELLIVVAVTLALFRSLFDVCFLVILLF